MKKTQKLLMIAFLSAITIGLAIILLFETDIIPCGIMITSDKSYEFVAASIMELLTICVIPLALRLFHFKGIANKLSSANSLMQWAMLRMMLLCIPMITNTILYYLFMNVAFGYMGIILFLCLFFIVPTKDRCETEIKQKE